LNFYETFVNIVLTTVGSLSVDSRSVLLCKVFGDRVTLFNGIVCKIDAKLDSSSISDAEPILPRIIIRAWRTISDFLMLFKGQAA